jgi:hypothetical protein
MPDTANGANAQHQGALSLLREHWPLLAIIVIYILLGLWYMRVIPPFEGPDEPQHFAYAIWLAQGKGLPPLGDEVLETDIQQEAGQPPLYYLLASLIIRLVDIDNPPAEYRPNPYFTAPLDREVPDNDNRAIHYLTDASPLVGG